MMLHSRWLRIISSSLGLGAGILLPQTMTHPMQPPARLDHRPLKTESSSPNNGLIQPIELTLAQVIQLVVEKNRDLKNAFLDRVIQRQQLRAEESKFNPRWTPSAGVTVTQNLSSERWLSGSSFSSLTGGSLESNLTVPNLGSGKLYQLSDRTSLNRNLQLSGELLTRIGTRVSLTVEPLSPQTLNLIITQPLLRGFGRSVNEASVKTARLTDNKNHLALRQTLIDTITDTINAYRTLIRDQEAVRIQEQSLASKQRQYEVIQALVQAGRRPKVDLVEAEQTIADTQRQLLQAQNSLAQSNISLLKLIDTGDTFQIIVPPDSIEQLVKQFQPKFANSAIAPALEIAYLHRPDYLQAKVDIETERLNLTVAQDNQRWQLDIQSQTSLGNSSQVSTGIVLSRTFGDPKLPTAVVERQIGVQKNQNRLAQLTARIRQEIMDELRNMESGLKQITAAERARKFADQQLEIVREKFKRGISNTSIFEVLQKENDLVNAQNSELNARIDLLSAIAAFDKVLGTTLETWQIPTDLSSSSPSVDRDKLVPNP